LLARTAELLTAGSLPLLHNFPEIKGFNHGYLSEHLRNLASNGRKLQEHKMKIKSVAFIELSDIVDEALLSDEPECLAAEFWSSFPETVKASFGDAGFTLANGAIVLQAIEKMADEESEDDEADWFCFLYRVRDRIEELKNLGIEWFNLETPID
jgi:hypothetical protein